MSDGPNGILEEKKILFLEKNLSSFLNNLNLNWDEMNCFRAETDLDRLRAT